jgi:hypothetical protein
VRAGTEPSNQAETYGRALERNQQNIDEQELDKDRTTTKEKTFDAETENQARSSHRPKTERSNSTGDGK